MNNQMMILIIYYLHFNLITTKPKKDQRVLIRF